VDRMFYQLSYHKHALTFAGGVVYFKVPKDDAVCQ
jgi:hypothetical protein